MVWTNQVKSCAGVRLVRWRNSLALIALAGGLSAGEAHAQCLNWGTEFSQVGPNSYVHSIVSWDDGTGPALYIGGAFTGSVGFPAAFVAKWDGAAWSSVGPTPDDGLWCLAVFDDGTGSALYAGGAFEHIGTLAADGIAKWNGSSWSALPPLISNFGSPGVQCMAVYDDGSGPALFVGGGFDGAIGVPSSNIIKWDGSAWSSVGGGVNGNAEHMVVFDDGTGLALYVAGYFLMAPGGARRLAKWNGSLWSSLGANPNNTIGGLVSFDDGSGPALYVSGSFSRIGGLDTGSVARWNGVSWSDVGNAAGLVRPLIVADDGRGAALFAGNLVSAGGVPHYLMSRWNGSTWSSLGSGVNNVVYSMGVHDSGNGLGPELYVGGIFNRVGDFPSRSLAHWRSCQAPIDSMCFGDGTVAPCPCSNTGSLGRGCQNSIATGGALLSSTGTVRPDQLVLHASNELPTALTIFLQGSAVIPGTAPFGDGLRCAGGTLKRLYVRNASAGAADAPISGEIPISARSAALGDPIAPGSVRIYQTYYRDPAPTFCQSPAGGIFNASNGLRVVW